MIGSIRKHAAWLWWLIAGLTIISFVWWGANPGARNGGGRNSGFGVIYGEPVTRDEFAAAEKGYILAYLQRNGGFPNLSANKTEVDRITYERIILARKAKELGIHISEEAQVAGANNFLAVLGARENVSVKMSDFIKALEPQGVTAADFQQFVIDDLAIDQLIQVLGLGGALVPPQEASQIYDREHQEVSAQAVFFAASNYLAQVTVTPAGLQQFYTNAMAYYRQPPRVQIHYLEYDLTNFLSAAEQKLGKTNIAAKADAFYLQKGKDAVPDAKTPEEAKAKLREMILRQGAGSLAVEKAREFLNTLFAIESATPESLIALAKTNGLTVHTTAPFSEAEGPDEFAAPAELIKGAFKLSADSPFAPKPIAGAESVYVVALAKQIPSEVPPLDQIRDRATRDFQLYEAAQKARAAGTNFYYNAMVQMTSGKTFAQTALASGQTPFALKPFSLSTAVVPEAEGHAEINLIKQAAFTTQPGHVSQFEPTREGGFVLYVQSLLPVDEASKASGLKDYLGQLRRGRSNEAFNLWLQAEENRELPNTPVFDELTGRKAAPRAQ